MSLILTLPLLTGAGHTILILVAACEATNTQVNGGYPLQLSQGAGSDKQLSSAVTHSLPVQITRLNQAKKQKHRNKRDYPIPRRAPQLQSDQETA
jgi:hypothetical protein